MDEAAKAGKKYLVVNQGEAFDSECVRALLQAYKDKKTVHKCPVALLAMGGFREAAGDDRVTDKVFFISLSPTSAPADGAATSGEATDAAATATSEHNAVSWVQAMLSSETCALTGLAKSANKNDAFVCKGLLCGFESAEAGKAVAEAYAAAHFS